MYKDPSDEHSRGNQNYNILESVSSNILKSFLRSLLFDNYIHEHVGGLTSTNQFNCNFSCEAMRLNVLVTCTLSSHRFTSDHGNSRAKSR